jgi:hypothetical protein
MASAQLSQSLTNGTTRKPVVSNIADKKGPTREPTWCHGFLFRHRTVRKVRAMTSANSSSRDCGHLCNYWQASMCSNQLSYVQNAREGVLVVLVTWAGVLLRHSIQSKQCNSKQSQRQTIGTSFKLVFLSAVQTQVVFLVRFQRERV